MQAWATLEVRRRDVKHARTLFQAALAANKEHAASWHGWGLLEKSEVSSVRLAQCLKGSHMRTDAFQVSLLTLSVGGETS